MMVATGFYIYFALTATKSLSAMHRTTIDTFETMLDWNVGCGWERFNCLQLVEFMGFMFGNLLFNEVVRTPTLRFLTAWSKENEDEEREHLQVAA